MDYELAKKLKEAGFPQKDRPFCVSTKMELDEKGEQVRCYMPTLSELIEACGEMFINLSRDTALKKEWFASGCGDVSAFGSTPEEAVAELWIELNK